MTVYLISHPNRHPYPPPSRRIRRRFCICQNHQTLHQTDMRHATSESSVEDDIGVREELAD